MPLCVHYPWGTAIIVVVDTLGHTEVPVHQQQTYWLDYDNIITPALLCQVRYSHWIKYVQ